MAKNHKGDLNIGRNLRLGNVVDAQKPNIVDQTGSLIWSTDNARIEYSDGTQFLPLDSGFYRYACSSTEQDSDIDPGTDNVEIGNLFVPTAAGFVLMDQSSLAPVFPTSTTMRMPFDMTSVSIEFYLCISDDGEGDVTGFFNLTKNGTIQNVVRFYCESGGDFNQFVIKYQGPALSTDTFQIPVGSTVGTNDVQIDRCSLFIQQLQ